MLKDSRCYQPARMLAFRLAGKIPMSSVSEAVAGYKAAQRFSQLLLGFLAETRLVEQDAQFNLWRTPQGDFWAPAVDDIKEVCWVLTEVSVGVYGEPGFAVRPGDTVVDCGANIGVFARHAFRARAKYVIAVEPAPAHAECLRRNLRTEISDGRLVLVEKGLWDQPCVREFTVSRRTSLANSFVMPVDTQCPTIELPLTTLDAIAHEGSIERVDFIKMDIEGAEQRALQGGRQTMARHHPRMAIGVEHELPTILDNAKAIRDLVLKIDTRYKSHCGMCIQGNDGLIVPQVLWFS
jgi:FkbM family methyltransferase